MAIIKNSLTKLKFNNGLSQTSVGQVQQPSGSRLSSPANPLRDLRTIKPLPFASFQILKNCLLNEGRNLLSGYVYFFPIISFL